MCLATLDVNASVSNELVKTGTWSIDVSQSGFTAGSTNTTIPFTVQSYVSDSGIEIEQYYYYKNFATSTILEADMGYYGYKVVLTPKTTTKFDTDAIWTRFIVGSSGELASGKAEYGVTYSSSASPTIWYHSDNGEFSLRVALQGYFTSSYVGDSKTTNEFTCKATWEYKIYGYTKAEYESLQDSIDQGNDLIEEGNELIEEGNKLQEEQNETSKGILSKITDFFGSFFDNLINSVIHLIVPTDEEFDEISESFVTFFNEHFGFLMFPINLFTDFMGVFFNSSPSSAKLTFPSFSIMGYKVWDNYVVDFKDLPLVADIFSYVRTGVGVILVFAFLNYLRDFFEKRFTGGS